MTSVLHLPRELLDITVKKLAPGDLYSLCRVNRDFQALAEPILYANITFEWLEEKHWQDEVNEYPPIVPLLQTLMGRPRLGEFVKTFHLYGDERHRSEEFDEPNPKVCTAALDIRNPCWFDQVGHFTLAKFWKDGVTSGSMDAVVTLLLSQFPNLTTLHLGPAFARENMFLELAILSGAITSRHFIFACLKAVEVEGFICDPDYPNPTGKAMGSLVFFYLPNVQRLTLSIGNPTEFTWPAAPPNPAALVALDLKRIRESRVGSILSVCTSLQSFSWEILYQPHVDTDVSMPIIDLDQVVAALALVRKTLTSLRLDFNTYFTLWDKGLPVTRFHGSIRPLTNFSRIRSFTAQWALLMGHSPPSWQLSEVIPRNLTKFTIINNQFYCEEATPEEDTPEEGTPEEDTPVWNQFTIFESIRAWLDNWRQHTPHLKEFALIMPWIKLRVSCAWGGRMRRELEAVCKTNGVERYEVIRDYPPFFAKQCDGCDQCRAPDWWSWSVD